MKSRVSVFCIFLTLSGALAFSQAITGSLRGRVFDKTGAVVNTAKVTAANTETGLSRSAKVSATGDYEIPQLPVGNYKVTAEAASFQPQSRTLELAIGQAADLDFTLAPGARSEEVTVTITDFAGNDQVRVAVPA